ncbi:MAG: Pr6Pr family membrane protein [Mycobacteriales bacterium]|nr:MAG: hypothetical protein DLM56_13270 [Pseudonocardiales bacterium]
MSPRLLHRSLRVLHLIAAWGTIGYVYGTVPRSVAQVGFVPILGLTGVAMWQLPGIRRSVRRHRDSAFFAELATLPTMRAEGVARLWAGLTAVIGFAAVVAQLVLVVRDNLSAVGYFSYYTIDSNLIVIVLAAMFAIAPQRDSAGWRLASLIGLLSIAITGIVYTSVLQGLVELGGVGRVTNIVFHYLIPIVSVLGWLVLGSRGRWRPSTLGLAVLFPLAWLAYTLIRGAVVHTYPYPFVDVDQHGYAIVARNCVAITVLFVIVGGVILLIDARAPSLRARRHRAAVAVD